MYDQFQIEPCRSIICRDCPAHVQKCSIIFRNEQPALSLVPAFFHGVQVQEIPETFQTSVVITAQPVANPDGAPYQIVGCLPHGHVAHANHVYRDHPDSYLVIFFLFCTLFRVLPVWCRPCLTEREPDLETLGSVRVSVQELWRVSIGSCSSRSCLIYGSSIWLLQGMQRAICIPEENTGLVMVGFFDIITPL